MERIDEWLAEGVEGFASTGLEQIEAYLGKHAAFLDYLDGITTEQ